MFNPFKSVTLENILIIGESSSEFESIIKNGNPRIKVYHSYEEDSTDMINCLINIYPNEPEKPDFPLSFNSFKLILENKVLLTLRQTRDILIMNPNVYIINILQHTNVLEDRICQSSISRFHDSISSEHDKVLLINISEEFKDYKKIWNIIGKGYVGEYNL